MLTGQGESQSAGQADPDVGWPSVIIPKRGGTAVNKADHCPDRGEDKYR